MKFRRKPVDPSSRPAIKRYPKEEREDKNIVLRGGKQPPNAPPPPQPQSSPPRPSTTSGRGITLPTYIQSPVTPSNTTESPTPVQNPQGLQNMKLEISNNSFKGTFSEFAKFRHQLAIASEIGVRQAPENIRQYQEFIPNIDYELFEEKNSLGEWDEVPDETLVILFVHSDSQGSIPVSILQPLCERLKEIEVEVEDNPFMKDTEMLTFLDQLKSMVIGFRQSFKVGKDVLFEVKS